MCFFSFHIFPNFSSKCFTNVSHLVEKNVSHQQDFRKMRTLTTKFFLRPSKKGNGKMAVYVRVIYNRTKADISTGMKCMKSDWDQQKERFVNSDSMNLVLNGLKEKIYRAKIYLDDQGQPYSNET